MNENNEHTDLQAWASAVGVSVSEPIHNSDGTTSYVLGSYHVPHGKPGFCSYYDGAPKPDTEPTEQAPEVPSVEKGE